MTRDSSQQAVSGEVVNQDDKTNAKELRVSTVNAMTPVIRFKGQHLIRVDGEWHTLTKELFETVFYSTFGGMSMQVLNETYNMVRAVAPDRSYLARYITFGDSSVFDMQTVSFTNAISSDECVYHSPFSPTPDTAHLADKFLNDVANGNDGVKGDIIQSMAPLLVTKKPSGVIWWQGRGRNGKTATMDILYALFPEQLSGLTLKQLEDERDTPVLNGKLGNIVRESSEGVVEDSRTYKAVGTHESFFVHKFHSQDLVRVDGSLHHLFSTNNMPIFNDKSDGARRRTLIVQFKNQFDDDPTFQERTFTDEFMGGFLHILIEAAKSLAERRFRYEWSDETINVKNDYDKVVNTAETFANWLVKEMDTQYFMNFTKLRLAYDWWCDNNGYTALGKTHLRNAVMDMGFRRSSKRGHDGKVQQIFLLNGGTTEGVNEFMPGIYGNGDGVDKSDELPEQLETGIW